MFQTIKVVMPSLEWSQFTSLSKGGFLRIATAQAFLCQILLQGDYRRRRACRKLFFHIFSEPNFLELYVKAVLNAKDKPSQALADSLQPLFMHIEHDDFQILVVPSAIKMLKRNPEIVMESIGDLLRHVKLDMSKYVIDFLSVVLPQVRHADDERRTKALAIVACLSQMSSDPDVLHSVFNAVKAVIEGSEGKLALPYQRIGMINALEELSRAPSGKTLNKLAPMISTFYLSCYKGDGSDDAKLAILAALSSWVSRSADTVQPNALFSYCWHKGEEILRKGHLKCLRIICKNSDS